MTSNRATAPADGVLQLLVPSLLSYWVLVRWVERRQWREQCEFFPLNVIEVRSERMAHHIEDG